MFFRLAKVHGLHECLVAHHTDSSSITTEFPSFMKCFIALCSLTCGTVVKFVKFYMLNSLHLKSVKCHTKSS